MLVLTRFPESGLAPAFEDRTAALLIALGERPGFLGGRLVRSTDENGGWVLVLDFETVGHWRRAFSPIDLRTQAMEYFAAAEDAGSAYEVLLEVGPGGTVLRGSSDRTDRQRGLETDSDSL